MLKRELEPEVMDTPQEATDYDAMDHGEVNRGFVDDLIEAGGGAVAVAAGEVIDLATGPAQIPIELCRRFKAADVDEARIVSVDLAAHMLDVANLNIEVAGFREWISLEQADCKALPHDDNRFATVLSNSLVHHVPQPAAAFTEAYRVCAPGGFLFFRDLLRPPDDSAVKRLVYQYAADCNEHQRAMFDASLRAALTLQEVRDLVSALGVDPKTVQTSSDRHWTWIAVKPG